MFPFPVLLQSNSSFSFHFSAFESFQEVICCPQLMCQDSHTSLFTPLASLTLIDLGRKPRTVLYSGPCISTGPHMKRSLGGKHRLCLAAWSENFSPVWEDRFVGNHFHTCDTSVFHHTRNAHRRDILGISSQGEFWLFRAAVEVFCIPKALRPGFFIWILLFFKSKWTSSLFKWVTVFIGPFLTQCVDDRENPGSKGKYFSWETPGAAKPAQEETGKAVSTTAQGR